MDHYKNLAQQDLIDSEKRLYSQQYVILDEENNTKENFNKTQKSYNDPNKRTIINVEKVSKSEEKRRIIERCLEIIQMEISSQRNKNTKGVLIEDNLYLIENVVSIRNIHKTYLIGLEGVPALRGVSLAVKKGEFLAILGTSGGGKTSLLNTIGTIDQPSRVIFAC